MHSPFSFFTDDVEQCTTPSVPTIMQLRTEKERVAHLLRRFGLGASEAEIDFYGKDGLKGAIDKLLNFEQTDEGWDVPFTKFANDKGLVNIRVLPIIWTTRLAVTRRPLQEKLTLFWHDHFATSTSKVDVAPAMYLQNETLRANCKGRFEDMLLAVSKDPAMIYWLDNQENVKGKPNENFAREVMELFTLGIGHYTEKDVQEGARAFTGWGFVGQRARDSKPRGKTEFLFRAAMHDDGEKAFLGNKGNFNGDDVLGILCGNPQTALYITKKMWEFFAYSNPEKSLIEKLAKKFRDSGLTVSVLVRAIMESEEFYSEKCAGKLYKTPVDFVMSTVRQLGLGTPVMDRLKTVEDGNALRAVGGMGLAERSMKAMGMELFNPPDVSGWDGKEAWVTTATMVERIKWASALFGDGGAPKNFNPNKGKGPGPLPSLRLPIGQMVQHDGTARGLARSMISVFDAVLPETKIKQIEQAAVNAAGGNTVSSGGQEVGAAVARLIFGSPEFQFC